ncbi:hypothetical protein ACFUJR_37625 [Streptomyces sp. NPDC057271]|uniref:hypothetical protein n=1 Tax=unclassified Streptomyces TaxID=2593676 RepID=UPI0036390D44
MPEVHVTGSVFTEEPPGPEEPRPLSGARYELWYLGKNGVGSETAVRPVLDGVGGTGNPVAGYLDENGAYSLDFIYPQKYQLPDGTEWEGCAPSAVIYLRSYACTPTHLWLKIFPKNEDVSIVVRDDTSPEEALAATVPLGTFFDRTSDRFHSSEPAAFAYRGAQNVRQVVGDSSGIGDIEIVLSNEGESHYRPLTGLVTLDETVVNSSTTEHEVGHSFLHDLYGIDFFDYYENCNPHYLTEVSSEKCAWGEGWAQFIALAAEKTSVHTHSDGNVVDLEDCGQCKAGGAVEGRVAGALWDLVDDTPDEKRNGFTDQVHYAIGEVISVVREAEPKTIDEFWTAWSSAHEQSRFSDRNVMFLNTLLYSGLLDAEQADTVGEWTDVVCADCVNGGAMRSNPPPYSKKPSVTWDLNKGLPAVLGGAGVYDVWVHIPAAADDQDPSATYDFKGGQQRETWRIDQTQHSGWIPLVTSAYMDSQDRYSLILSHDRDEMSTRLSADAVMVVRSHL